jgi:SAM-dependent methyltransferase
MAGPSDDRADQIESMREFGLRDDDVAAWLSARLPSEAFRDWLTDRVARRPAGQRARAVYGAEHIHDWARRAILDVLKPGPGDRLLDVGCGGGLLLRDALSMGASAAGVDHSPEMVELARERAVGARVVLASAAELPFADDAFDALSMSMVLFFFDDPVAALREARRVLRPGGRLAVYTTSPALRGTPAAPEPLASRSHFYSEGELGGLARQAGFRDVCVVAQDGGQLLTGTG